MKKIILIILLIIWMFIIFGLSNQTGTVSGSNSTSILTHFLSLIFKNNVTELVNVLENPLRECMHSFEYFILTLLFFNILIEYKFTNKVIITLEFIFISSALDEIHQLFISGRSFEYFDIFMDMLGCIMYLILRRIYGR